MPYTTVYLQYSETRNRATKYEESEDENLDEDIDDYDYDDPEGSCYTELDSIKPSVKEPRGDDDAEYEESEDETLDEDIDDYDYDDSEGRCYIEFNPIKLSVKEPRGDSVEIELDFEVDVGDTLHLIVVRYNNHRSGVLEDWCVERVFRNGDEAEELVEGLEDGLANAECAEDKNGESIVVKSEVFSMQLQK